MEVWSASPHSRLFWLASAYLPHLVSGAEVTAADLAVVTDFPVVRRERFTVVGLPLRIFPEGFLLRAFRAHTAHPVFQMDLLRRIIRAGSPLPDFTGLAAAQIIDCDIPGRIR